MLPGIIVTRSMDARLGLRSQAGSRRSFLPARSGVIVTFNDICHRVAPRRSALALDF
jgi:hypothetical protein